MNRRKRAGRRWLPLACVLAAGAVTTVAVGLLYKSAESEEAAEALCVEIAQLQNPGSDIEVLSTEKIGYSLYVVSGSMTDRGTSPVEFECMAYSDGHDGWGAVVGDEDSSK